MLVLSRRQGESIILSDHIEISITEIKGDQVRLGIAAPKSIKIFRKEIHEQIQEEMRSAVQNLPTAEKLSDLQRLLTKHVATNEEASTGTRQAVEQIAAEASKTEK